jgi:hypothetical protein
MHKSLLFPLVLGALGCDANVVDAVRDPPPTTMEPDPTPTPAPKSPLETSLLHRYGFEGDGAVALDSKGAAHGQLVASRLSGSGSLRLEGARTGQYVNLPNGMVSGLTSATFEAWLSWDGGGPWQRIFDFGNNTAGEDLPGNGGTKYFFLTTAASTDVARGLPSALRVAYSQNGVDDEDICSGTAPLPTKVLTHVAVVVDASAQTFSLYQDGGLLAECPLTRPLAAIDDVNDWLGHSNFSADSDLGGSVDEFRVYGAALTAEELTKSFAAGPDAQP